MTAGPTVLVAGGGTGGHVVPALAVAEALRVARPELAVEFVGTARGLESRLVPAAGWMLHEIEALPLARRVSPQALRLPFALVRGTRAVAALARARGAVAAVTFGGYVSVPLDLAAWRARIPLVVHESNAVPGIANRLASRWAEAVAVNVAETASRFPDPARVTVTGMPVRPGLGGDREALRTEAMAAFDLDPERRTLLVFGGSQGAQRVNEAVVASAARWPHPERLQVLHAAGRRDAERVEAAWAAATAGSVDGPRVRCVPFIERMDLAYAAADVVVSRAGASTIGELTVLGLPSVLVPYPHATDDHQTANARALADAGAAEMIADGDLDADVLVRACAPLLDDDARRAAMAAAARGLGRDDAAAQVAALVLSAIDRHRPGAPR